MIFDEFSKEALEVYKQTVLPNLWEFGVEEKDFYDAVKACAIIRKSEK